jgi:hypothetical protein
MSTSSLPSIALAQLEPQSQSEAQVALKPVKQESAHGSPNQETPARERATRQKAAQVTPNPEESSAAAIQRKAGPALRRHEEPTQQQPGQKKPEQEERRPHPHQGLQGLATLCSGIATNSVSAGAVSPT